MAGETKSVAASAARNFYDNPGAGAFFASFDLTFSTVENELNDVNEAGYLPPNTRVIAVFWAPTDMDTNGTPTLVHSVQINGVNAVTGLTGAQTGTASLSPVLQAFSATTPPSTPALVRVISTTAAATAAAGSAKLILLCQHA